jgi:hypothetical protein
VADLVTSLRLREVSAARREILHLPPEREAGVAGYSAGRTDFEATPATPRHRAATQAAIQPAAPSETTGAETTGAETTGAETRGAETRGAETRGKGTTFHEEVVRTTADLDTMIAQAGVIGTGGTAHRVPPNLPPVPDTAESVNAPEAGPTRRDRPASLSEIPLTGPESTK